MGDLFQAAMQGRVSDLLDAARDDHMKIRVKDEVFHLDFCFKPIS